MDHYQYFIRDRRNFRNSRYSDESDFDFKACPAPPQPTKEEEGSNLAKVIQAMGITACSTDNTQVSAKISASIGPFLRGGASFDVNKTATVGCETIIATAEKYNKTVQNVACMLNQSKNVETTDVQLANNVIFRRIGKLRMMCGDKASGSGLKIKQGIELKVVKQVNFNQKEIQQIANQCKDIVKSTTEDIQTTKTGAGATPQGSKLIKDVSTKIYQIDFAQNVKQSLNKVKTSFDAQNNFIMEDMGEVDIVGGECNFDQTIVFNLIATSIVDNTLQSSFSNLSETLREVKQTTKQESEATGPEMSKGFWEEYGKSERAGMIVFAIIAVVLIIALIFVGPTLLKIFMGGDE